MDIIERIVNLIIPPICIGCKQLLDYDTDSVLCPECLSKWESEKNSLCPICHSHHTECSCPICYGVNGRNKLPIYHLAEYTKEDSVVRNIVLYCKDNNYNQLFAFITSELYNLGIFKEIDRTSTVFTYVPRDRVRKNISGVDQAKSIAKRLAKLTGANFVTAIKRNTTDEEQKHLSARERKINAERSYSPIKKVISSVAGKTVILCDDIVTTGSTVIACAKTLRRLGANQVIIVAVARNYAN